MAKIEIINFHEIKQLEEEITIEAFSSGLSIGSAFWMVKYQQNNICCMMNLV